MLEEIAESVKAIILLVKIFIFGKTILLTPFPINITENFYILLDKPISSITESGRISISSKEAYQAWLDGSNKIEKKFPKGSVIVKLYDDEGKAFILDEIGYWQDGIILFSQKPIEKKFYSIEVITSVSMTEAKIEWTNYWM